MAGIAWQSVVLVFKENISIGYLIRTEPRKGHRTVFLSFFISLPRDNKSFPQGLIIPFLKFIYQTMFKGKTKRLNTEDEICI